MDYVNNKLAGNDSGTPSIRSSTSADLVRSSRNSQDQQLETRTTNLLANSPAPDSTLNNSSDENFAHIPLELIAHCVAALFMIQVNFRIIMYYNPIWIVMNSTHINVAYIQNYVISVDILFYFSIIFV